MGDEEVNVLGGNSSAFRVLVISLTTFLGALIGAILLFELLLYLYQRLTNKNDAEAKDGRLLYSHCFTAQLLLAYFFAGSSYFVNFFVT